MIGDIAYCDYRGQRKYRRVQHDTYSRAWQNTGMQDRQSQFFAQWRKHRGMTQSAASEATGIPQGYLSDLERGARRFNQDHLEALAQAYRCSPADLLGRDPGAPDATAEIVDIWEHIKPGDREVARRVLRSLGQSDA